MKVASFEYHAPESVEQALELLDQLAPENGIVLAGGQSLIPSMAFRLAQPSALIDINRITSLNRIEADAKTLEIGSCIRHSAFHMPVVQGPLGKLLQEVGSHIAHYPIRSRGTFCGSLAYSDPASEWCLVTIALGGTLRIARRHSMREISADEYFLDLMTTTLEPEELIISASLPVLPPESRFGFHEISRRPGDFAMAMALVVFRLAEGRMMEVRITPGGVEGIPRRIEAAENIAEGEVPTEKIFEAAADAAAADILPLDDPQIPSEYRRELTRASVLRAFRKAAEQ
jgi:aerobic carbon-monoxide dehydrogenase medium subunit